MKLKELIKQQDVTLSQLARRINVAKQSVFHWCEGDTCPNAKKVIAIAKALNVTEQEILDCFK